MTHSSFRRWLPGLLGLLAVAGLALLGVDQQVEACPFCSMQGQTLTGDVNQASMVLYGTLSNAKPDPNGDFGGGSTDLNVSAVIKDHEILGKKRTLTLPRYVPSDKDAKTRFLIFCDVFKGKIDPYRGVPVKSDDIVTYLKGALANKDKDIGARLKFFFDYLDNSDVEISNDAYKEFGNADYKDYKDIAKTLPADKIAKWLQDPNTPSFRFGLYASMLGHCGKEGDAQVLRGMLDDPQKRVTSGVDGILAGYTMLKHKEGWTYVCDILKDSKKEFMLRYAGLRAVRFFWESRPDLVDQKDMVAALMPLLDQSDISDLAIEDLRKWKRWEVLDQVLALNAKSSHNIPIIRRAILRFALTCEKDQPKAAAFAKAMREKDADWVKDVEELLKLESTTK